MSTAPRPSLYPRLLGDRFHELPAPVARLHRLDGVAVWTGRADVRRGHNPVARIIAMVCRLPADGADQPLEVVFTPDGRGGETWERHFGRRRFVSHQSERGDLIAERVGPVTLHLRPEASADGLNLRLVGARLLGLPLPSVLLPEVRTRESAGADGRYNFAVEAHLPLFGLLVAYAGWLTSPSS